MKTFFALFAGFLMSTSIVSADTADSVRTQLCDFWRYDFQTNTYTCNYLGRYVNLMEAKRSEELITKLETKIADLEKRIEKLEE